MLVRSCGPNDWLTSVWHSTYLQQASPRAAKRNTNDAISRCSDKFVVKTLLNKGGQARGELISDADDSSPLSSKSNGVSSNANSNGSMVYNTDLLTFFFLCHISALHHLFFRAICTDASVCHMLLSIRKHLGSSSGNCKVTDIRLKLFAAKQHTAAQRECSHGSAAKAARNDSPEEQHGVELSLRLLCNSTFAELIVAGTRSVVAEHVVRFGKVLELGVGFGIVWDKNEVSTSALRSKRPTRVSPGFLSGWHRTAAL